MRLDLSDDQRAIEEVFAAFFRRESPVAVVRAAEPLGFDPSLWAQFFELGGPGMGAPESGGGGGAGLGDLAVVVDHLGQTVAPVPFVEHTIATRVTARFDAHDDDVVGGAMRATAALRPAFDDGCRLAPAVSVAAVVIGVVGDDRGVSRDAAPGT